MNGDRTISEFIKNAFDKTKDSAIKEIRVKLFTEIKEKISRQQSYNYDYENIDIFNIEKGLLDFINEYKFKNDLPRKFLKTVKKASWHGMSATLLRVDNSIITQNVSLISRPKKRFDVITEVYLSEDEIDLKNYDEDSINYMKLYLNNSGKYVLDQMITKKNEEGDFDFSDGEVKLMKEIDDETGEEYEVPARYVYDAIDYCPLEILENNEDAKGDWEYACETMRLESKFNALIEKEWEYMKVMLLQNIIYNGDKTATEIQKDIEDGEKRVHETADPDGQLQQALSYLSSGGVTTDILINIKQKYKDDIRELTFSFGQMGGSNNKHTSEVVSTHIDAFKYLYTKKIFFKSYLQNLLWKILDMSKSFNENIVKIDVPSVLDVNLQLSRPLEILMNLNADSSEQDQPTQKFIQERKDIDVNTEEDK